MPYRTSGLVSLYDELREARDKAAWYRRVTILLLVGCLVLMGLCEHWRSRAIELATSETLRAQEAPPGAYQEKSTPNGFGKRP